MDKLILMPSGILLPCRVLGELAGLAPRWGAGAIVQRRLVAIESGRLLVAEVPVECSRVSLVYESDYVTV